MPRQSGTSIQNKFIRGLITEATALSFPEDACTSTDNVVFDNIGRITRRLGIDVEENFTTRNVAALHNDAYTEFVWVAPSGTGTKSFVIQQHGGKLSIYDSSESADISNSLSTEIDLNDFIADESNTDPSTLECQYAAGNGDLFVVNSACDPFYISYDLGANTFSTTKITLSQRDFEGLDDGLAIDTRPTDDVATTTNPNHLYNLVNQGWGLTDALTQWDTARTDLPSNADYAELYRGSATDAFDNSHVDANDPGNRPAPQGHFILEVAKQNRQEVFEAEGYIALTSSSSFSVVDRTEGSIIGDFTQNPGAAFDGQNIVFSSVDPTAAKFSATDAYLGKNFGTNPKSINRVTIYSTVDIGFVSSGSLTNIQLYGKNSLPANGTDGTLLGSTGAIADTAGPVTITSSDKTTPYQYVWIYVQGTTTASIALGEIILYANSFAFVRPTCVEFYAGRVFYGGISTSTLANNIYFSQIIESKDQYGQCYQKNDPTCPIPDLLPDDGGVVKIPDMGTLRRLYAYQSALLVFATNGVWIIQGSTGSNFKATDYVVKKISSIGMNSPMSLVSIKGLPSWWGEDGIYTVQFDPNYDSFTPSSLTLTTIDTFYLSTPPNNRRYVKGTYDEENQIAYWLFDKDPTLADDFYRYDSILVLDTRSKAFYTWSFTGDSIPIIRSIYFVRPADRTSDSKVKYFIHINFNATTADETFGSIEDTTYTDWVREGSNIDYTSTFTTGYKLDGKTQFFFQPSYIFVYLETEDNSSCYVQPIFDFTTDSSTGKWGTAQQVYNNGLLSRSHNYRRLKMRGQGRALQLKFTSDTGKPFNIIGWSLYETTNSSL